MPRQRPEDVIGMHFFSPANVMPLLEVVRTKATSPISHPHRHGARQAAAQDAGAGQGVLRLHRQSHDGRLRARGRSAWCWKGRLRARWTRALEQCGMAMGILAVFDMAGIDVGVNVHRANASQYPPDPAYYQADVALHDAGVWARRTARAITAMSRAIARGSTIPRPSRSCARRARGTADTAARAQRPKRSWSAACFR